MNKITANNTELISVHLAKLATEYLNENELSQLTKIINKLFDDLNDGHSCTNIKSIVLDIGLSAAQILDLLIKSKLCAIYKDVPSVLQTLPLSICYFEDTTGLLYVTRYLNYELQIFQHVNQFAKYKLSHSNGKMSQVIDVLFKLHQYSNRPNQAQLAAIQHSLANKFSIITGGPGTGKTTAVTLLLWSLYQLYGDDIEVKICAPTGKAARRVRESVAKSIYELNEQSNNILDTKCFSKILAQKDNFSTIHKLLGVKNNNIYFQHNQENKLNVDVLIIDESSMIGLPLFSKLLSAIDEQTIKHIVFLGDKNQLSSVEEGYVFASLVGQSIMREDVAKIDLFSPPLEHCLASELTVGNRSNSDIAMLANAILGGDENLARLTINTTNSITRYDSSLKDLLRTVCGRDALMHKYLDYVDSLDVRSLDIDSIFKQFTTQTTLCLTNVGILGTQNINREIEKNIKRQRHITHEWYTGRAIMILQNDYRLDLFNGDIGICIMTVDGAQIIFENGRKFIPEVLPQYTLAYAITIHKSQGSEYDSVNVVLPNSDGNLMQASRELVYTAVTRARQQVNLFANESTVINSTKIVNNRTSGLNAIFAKAIN